MSYTTVDSQSAVTKGFPAAAAAAAAAAVHNFSGALLVPPAADRIFAAPEFMLWCITAGVDPRNTGIPILVSTATYTDACRL
jgi:hypothetical protein